MSALSSYVDRSTLRLKEVVFSIRAKLSIARANNGEHVTADGDRRGTPHRKRVETHSVLFHVETVINEARDMAYKAREAVIIIEYDFVDVDHDIYDRGFLFGPASFWRQQIEIDDNAIENLTQSFFLAVRPPINSDGNELVEIVKEFFPGLIEQESPDTSGRVLGIAPIQAVFHQFDTVVD